MNMLKYILCVFFVVIKGFSSYFEEEFGDFPLSLNQGSSYTGTYPYDKNSKLVITTIITDPIPPNYIYYYDKEKDLWGYKPLDDFENVNLKNKNKEVIQR